MPECDGESFLELARGLQKRYCLPSKVEVRGKACDIVAEVYRRVQAKEKLFVWVHAEDVPDAFRADDLAVEFWGQAY
jgi:hypothetical protein